MYTPKNSELEIISHSFSGYEILLSHMFYSAPHYHRDIEICYLLSGNISHIVPGQTFFPKEGDIWITNSFQVHEVIPESSIYLLVLQFPPSLFSSYFPKIENIIFSQTPLSPNSNYYPLVHDLLLEIAKIGFQEKENSVLYSVGLINILLNTFLKAVPCKLVTDSEKASMRSKTKRIHRITSYIDEHYTQKLLLSDIAESENLSLYYLSHFFKDTLNMTFQEYLAKKRSERARELLLQTNYSLLDISMACGFSDLKYLQSSFQKYYGCTPKDYKSTHNNNIIFTNPTDTVSTEELLTFSDALKTLDELTSPILDIAGLFT